MERLAVMALVLLLWLPAAAEEKTLYPGAQVERLEGEVVVDGRPTGAALFRTGDEPQVVIDFFRARLEREPVDLVEMRLEDGLLLAALDHRSGQHLVIAARRTAAGETEVIRGWSGPAEAAAPPDEGLPLPPELVLVSRIDDRAGGVHASTRIGFAAVAPGRLVALLDGTLEKAGWRQSGDAPGAGALWRRAGSELHATVVGEAGGSSIEIRLIERDAR